MLGRYGLSAKCFRLPAFAVVVAGAGLFAGVGAAAAAPCQGAGAPTTTETKCLTAVQIPGNPLKSFDISWVNPDRAEYYLGDRSNKGVDIIDTQHNVFKRTIGGFVGIVLNSSGAVDNNHSGPDGVTSHGRWLYAGDGNSTLHVIDLLAPAGFETKAVISTGGTTRLDEMALTTDGKLIIAANNAEDPPFATLFTANGDSATNSVTKITKVSVDTTLMPTGFGLSLEQPTWEPKTARFYVSVPIIADNPAGCNYGQLSGPVTCSGGLLVIDPTTLSAPTATMEAFNPATNTGLLAINSCGPNGITVGPHENLLQGCNPGNVPSNTSTLVINAETKHFANIGGITGSDEVYYNAGDNRYYTGSSSNLVSLGGPAMGVISAKSNLLIETIPASTSSHSVAADSRRNEIFLPEVAPTTAPGPGGDKTGVSLGVCGGANGCIAVYVHHVDDDDQFADNDDRDRDRDRDHDRGDHDDYR
jgi:hypothetical protein